MDDDPRFLLQRSPIICEENQQKPGIWLVLRRDPGFFSILQRSPTICEENQQKPGIWLVLRRDPGFFSILQRSPMICEENQQKPGIWLVLRRDPWFLWSSLLNLALNREETRDQNGKRSFCYEPQNRLSTLTVN